MPTPLDVDPKDRKKGWLVFFFLLALYLTYGIVYIVQQAQLRNNPPMAFSKSNLANQGGGYKQPIYRVCPSLDVNVTATSDSIFCNAYFFDDGRADDCSATIDDEEDNKHCVIFNSARNVTLTGLFDEMILVGFWDTVEYDYLDPDYQVAEATMYLTIADTEEELESVESTEVLIPMGASSVVVQHSELSRLGGETKAHYTAAVTPITLVGDDAPTNDKFIQLSIRLESLTIDIIKEVDPLSWQAILGVLAGAYNYVALLFAIFFVIYSEPTLQWRFAGKEVHRERHLERVQSEVMISMEKIASEPNSPKRYDSFFSTNNTTEAPNTPASGSASARVPSDGSQANVVNPQPVRKMTVPEREAVVDRAV